ncbi:MAG: 3-hydroxybutyryl-CoA dehydrogenase [Polyangiaceae bacterium]|jgi:3-hydroxybutyryl-CoA dehydrogenase|nr:3-hydroxybutyryl-CoA dehydrogenase [Polyangiaceae bacterium]MBK8937902.1 3-hydroxybutyryl-CoA dehydrogenase [Polyangiaceae bacterium]
MSSETIQRIAVIGAGQMGRGIAQVAASAGIEVLLSDASLELATKGRDTIAGALARLVEKGKLAADVRDATVARITPLASGGDLGACDLAVEAATERFDTKIQIFKATDLALKPGAILASNTSSISITKLAAATSRPDRVVGMHFMNPVPLMKLVEVVRGLQTSQATYDATKSLAIRLGKTVVTSNDAPGFMVNRILIPMLCEACFALQEGVGAAEDIDTGAKLGLNHPMGPLELADLIGLDTVLAIANVLHEELGDSKYRAPVLLKNLVAAGWLGKKAGRGFYRYDEKGQKVAS